MTNANATSANDTALPERVASWENRAVKGEALCVKTIHDDHASKVADLRKRQEAYEAGLPKDPVEALREVQKTLLDMSDLSEPEYAPRAVLEIIYQLTIHGALDGSAEIKDALYWLTSQGLEGLQAVENATERARDIAAQFSEHHRPFEA